MQIREWFILYICVHCVACEVLVLVLCLSTFRLELKVRRGKDVSTVKFLNLGMPEINRFSVVCMYSQSLNAF